MDIVRVDGVSTGQSSDDKTRESTATIRDFMEDGPPADPPLPSDPMDDEKVASEVITPTHKWARSPPPRLPEKFSAMEPVTPFAWASPVDKPSRGCSLVQMAFLVVCKACGRLTVMQSTLEIDSDTDHLPGVLYYRFNDDGEMESCLGTGCTGRSLALGTSAQMLREKIAALDKHNMAAMATGGRLVTYAESGIGAAIGVCSTMRVHGFAGRGQVSRYLITSGVRPGAVGGRGQVQRKSQVICVWRASLALQRGG